MKYSSSTKIDSKLRRTISMRLLGNLSAAVLAIMLLINMNGCKKAKAEKTLRGEWLITKFSFYVPDNCYNQWIWCNGENEIFGNAIFERNSFIMTFRLTEYFDPCIPTYFTLKGEWNVDQHNRTKLFFHSYETTLDGESWYTEFNGESHLDWGEKAADQDIVFMSHLNADGTNNYLVLTRE